MDYLLNWGIAILGFHFKKNEGEIREIYNLYMRQASADPEVNSFSSFGVATLLTYLRLNTQDSGGSSSVSQRLLESAASSRLGRSQLLRLTGTVLTTLLPDVVPSVIKFPIHLIKLPLKLFGKGGGNKGDKGKLPVSDESTSTKTAELEESVASGVIQLIKSPLLNSILLAFISFWIAIALTSRVPLGREYNQLSPVRKDAIMVSLPYLSFIVLNYTDTKIYVVRFILAYFIYCSLRFVFIVVLIVVSSLVAQ